MRHHAPPHCDRAPTAPADARRPGPGVMRTLGLPARASCDGGGAQPSSRLSLADYRNFIKAAQRRSVHAPDVGALVRKKHGGGPAIIAVRSTIRKPPKVQAWFLRTGATRRPRLAPTSRNPHGFFSPPEPIDVALLGLGFARQGSLNHIALTLCSVGPWDRGNTCRRRPRGGRGSGWVPGLGLRRHGIGRPLRFAGAAEPRARARRDGTGAHPSLHGSA